MAGKKALVERRHHERIPVAIPVFVRGTDSEGQNFLDYTTMLNISCGGALLFARRYLPSSSVLSLEIPSAPSLRRPVLPGSVGRLRARLLRISPLDGYHLWGLRFSTALGPRKHGRRKKHSVS